MATALERERRQLQAVRVLHFTPLDLLVEDDVFLECILIQVRRAVVLQDDVEPVT